MYFSGGRGLANPPADRDHPRVHQTRGHHAGGQRDEREDHGTSKSALPTCYRFTLSLPFTTLNGDINAGLSSVTH